MCGILGASGTKINADKLKILALYNDSRGKDSCGIWDGELNTAANLKMTSEEGYFKEFLQKNRFNTKSPVILAHARAASPGILVNKDNAHPFEFSSIVGTHNGIIRNAKELSEKYHTQCHASDSKTLFEIINKIFEESLYPMEDTAKLLGEYLGAAALAFTDKREEGSLYLFRGESVRLPKQTQVWEERPLYIHHAGKTLYYSSMDSSLLTAFGAAQDIDGNVLYKYVNGEYVEEAEVDRTDAYHDKIIQYVIPNNPKNNHKKDTENSLFLDEQLPKDFFVKGGRGTQGKIYFLAGRYWKNGHIVAKDCFLPLYVTDEGKIVYNPDYLDEETGDFQHTDEEGKYVEGTTYYFFNGNMFVNREKYLSFIQKYTKDGKLIVITNVMSDYFLTPFRLSDAKRLLNYDYNAPLDTKWKVQGQLNGKFSFPLSDNYYYFSDGKNNKIMKKEDVDTISGVIPFNIGSNGEVQVDEEEDEVGEYESKIYLILEEIEKIHGKINYPELNRAERALYELVTQFALDAVNLNSVS